jgi:predicted NAD/FAD-dependent oxidoreductase
MSSREVLDVAIVGAGLSGLSCARELMASGKSLRVLEKGRGVGGRLATRRIGSSARPGQTASFDHGAQFFTARSPEFAAEVEAWQAQDLARPWFRGQSTLLENGTVEEKPDGHPRFCSPRGASAITKHLARGVDVENDVRVTQLEHDGEIWTLHAQAPASEPTQLRAKSLVLTPPVPQSLELLAASSIELPPGLAQVLGGMRYERCIAVMLWLSQAPRVPNGGALYAKTSKLSWLGDNASKGVSEVPALTLHGAPEWSAANWETGDAYAVAQLSQAAHAFWSGKIVVSSITNSPFPTVMTDSSSLANTLSEPLRQPFWWAALASVSLHGVFGAAAPTLSNIIYGGNSSKNIPGSVGLVELTPTEAGRLPQTIPPRPSNKPFSIAPVPLRPSPKLAPPLPPAPPTINLPALPPGMPPPGFFSPLPYSPLPPSPAPTAPATSENSIPNSEKPPAEYTRSRAATAPQRFAFPALTR